jgi:DNA-directed RNA polymerase subunit beta
MEIPTEISETTVSEFSIHEQKSKSSFFGNKFYGPSRSSTARKDVFKIKNKGNSLKKEAAFQYRGKNTIISNVEMEQDLIPKRQVIPTRVRIYLAEKRKIQVGDKVAGRHGNKGIISVLLPRIDMPYLPDGRVVDMILNPLGVPSRMNVGQVFECLLGLAGVSLNQHYRIPPFDEMYGPEASRSLVYLKLYQARLRSGQHWLFHPTSPGKTRLTDGRTGEPFDQLVTTGTAYIIKLVHLVDEKIHARSTGPYSLVTKQPLGGRSKHGGQRLGEMEVWALEGFGAAYTLQEMLTSKSDDVLGRQEVLKGILSKKASPLGNPEAFKVLVRELQSLCLDIRVSVLRGSPMRRERVDISEIK